MKNAKNLAQRNFLYVMQQYGQATVVFDGYDSGSSTKDNAHLRRTREQMTNNNECKERCIPFKLKEQTIKIFQQKCKAEGKFLPQSNGALIFDEIKVVSSLIWNSRSHKIIGLAMTEEN